jgi:hypothetical protein
MGEILMKILYWTTTVVLAAHGLNTLFETNHQFAWLFAAIWIVTGIGALAKSVRIVIEKGN